MYRNNKYSTQKTQDTNKKNSDVVFNPPSAPSVLTRHQQGALFLPPLTLSVYRHTLYSSTCV